MVDVVDDVEVVDEVVVDDTGEEVEEDELLLPPELLEAVMLAGFGVGVFSVPKSEIKSDEPLNVSTLPFSPDITQKDDEMQDTELSLPTWS